MTSNVIGAGRWDVPAAPDWAPAEQHVPHLLPELMYMGRTVDGDTVIHQYKHHFTRRYINLDKSGQAWEVSYRSPSTPWDEDGQRVWEASCHRVSLVEAEQALDLDPEGYAGF